MFITGDDEQSDFYYEAGPTCGIPGVIPWWETEKHPENGDSEMDPNFQKILTGSFDYLTNSSQRNFKTRVSKLLARVSTGRIFSVYWRISAFFLQIFDNPEIRTNLEKK